MQRIVHLVGDRTGEEREAVLGAECRGDVDLRREILAILDGPTVSTGALFDASRSAPAAPAALPEELGPYRVRRELGRGGMGVVYEAADGRTGRTVALKSVFPHLLSEPRLVERFEREAAAGRRISHANVVRTLALEKIATSTGEHHVLVMEYVEGRTLRELLDSLGPLPEALLRELGRQVAAGLEAIHAAGVVHRDLKPENVLVTDDQRVRIMDLGVARLQEASAALTREGEFVGSLLYAAPEQFRGDEAGPAADLYSLGVVLYELATGRNPFDRPGAAAVVSAHVEHEPPPLDRGDRELSPFLAAVVRRLLAKRPGDRFPGAADLRDAFERGEESEWWAGAERAVAVPERTRPRVPVARELSFEGRDAALDALRRAWIDARAGRGSTVLVEAEPGLGKTRLVDAFLEEIAGDGGHLLYGSFPPSGGAEGLAEAFHAKFGERLADEIQWRLGAGPDAAAALAGVLRGGGGSTAAFASVCHRLFHSLVSERPVVWVLDDLDCASVTGLAAARSLAAAVADAPALLVVTAAPGEIGGALARVGPFRRVVLERLDVTDTEAILREEFGSEGLAAELAATIHERAEGVPLFVAELVLALRDGGYLQRDQAGDLHLARPIADLGLSGAARDAVASRLAGLSDDDRDLLSVAAVAGAEFDAEVVSAVAGRPLVAALRRLAELERRGGVVRAIGRRFCFDHGLVAEHLYSGLPELLREEYHGLFAAAEMGRGGEIAGDRAASLVRHALLSRRPEEAVPHLLDALGHMAGRYRHEEYIETAERALSIEGLLGPELRARILLRICPVLGVIGRGERMEAAAREARRLAADAGDAMLRARAHRELGVSLAERGLNRRSVPHYRAAARLAGVAGEEGFRGLCLANVGIGLLRTAGPRAAEAPLREASELAKATGDASAEAVATANLSALLNQTGRREESRAMLERCLEVATETGLARVQSYAEASLGLGAWQRGDFDEAERRSGRALRMARETGDRRTEMLALDTLSLVAIAEGDYPDAIRHQQKILGIARATGDRVAESRALVAGAQFRVPLGDFETSREEAEAAVALAREIEYETSEVQGLLCLAEIALEEDDLDRAREHQERVRARLKAAGTRAGLAFARIALGRTEQAAGRADAAADHYEAARDLGREVDLPGVVATAVARLAEMGRADLAEAASVYEELAGRCVAVERMEALLALGRATGDRERLKKAERILYALAGCVAEERDRERMLGRVRLNREVLEAARA